MRTLIFFFKRLLLLAGCAGIASCSFIGGQDEYNGHASALMFAVLDVGQGLSQIACRNSRAVVWDMGDTPAFGKWQDGYAALQSPFIEAIVISHGDMDHKGGLGLLPADAHFSGLVITSFYEDTAGLRAFAKDWSPSIHFRPVRAGDTLALLQGVYIECLWPPKDSTADQWFASSNNNKNRFSLCFRVEYGNTSFFITSDIDTFAENKIVEQYRYMLRSDIVVVPHHGSAGSMHSLFYGYADPSIAIISCGMNNQYNHPADAVVRFLAFQMLYTLFDTRFKGHVVGASNGNYWSW